MKKIAAINGSPKLKNCVSEMFIGQTEAILETKITIVQAVQTIQQNDIHTSMAEVLDADALLIVFPLYIDSLPAPLVRLLTLLEREATQKGGRLPVVYAICNCGFYEAEQTRFALDMIESFTIRAGIPWGYGIGVGSGGFILSRNRELSKGATANIYAALRQLGEAIQEGIEKKENVFVTPKIPRFWYRFTGHIGWHRAAKKYGTRNSLKAKPYITHMEKNGCTDCGECGNITK